jgi:hypothetical protein
MIFRHRRHSVSPSIKVILNLRFALGKAMIGTLGN